MIYNIFALLIPSLIPITAIVCATICELHDKSLCSIALFVIVLLTLPKYSVSSKKS